MIIKISDDFSDTPGARYYKDGDNSGQEFYETKLRTAFKECFSKKETLFIDFDDCYGFASSFLSESFGRLAKEFGADNVIPVLQFISTQDPMIPSQVLEIIKNPERDSIE